MKPFFTLLMTATIWAGLASCEKNKTALIEQDPLLIRPISDEQILAGSVLDQIELYYFHHNVKRQVPDFGRAPGSGYQAGILYSKDIVSLSANDQVKNYYLKFPDGDIDTLYVDYEWVSEDEGRKEACTCVKPLRSFLIDGKPVPLDTIRQGGMDVYRLNK